MIIDLDVCRPEVTIEEQIRKLEEEVVEVWDAIKAYRKCEKGKKDKARAEILFELLDVMNAAQTGIYSMFNEDEIVAGCQYTNAKNFIRRYLVDEKDE
ncbi:hypothetical protein SAMN02745671_01681 [Anaerovibrio lipolyticus DSM 3074]|uniref:Uncharacterized protein n=2 Tax=Anaerovibrio lipolyticus TaxID=82374 RepID=A0A0B2JVE0_9FIRM|nr:hypothetical protein [Anaerovibrio lipolyticus]KHM51614.1 hypothetical protein NZ47_09530 [Anaerovibrio lipolyticus]SHI78725.1 hypothetical protein SAMN02745671_01681 [Anaerovibrio lipolyticus DSM 3074]